MSTRSALAFATAALSLLPVVGCTTTPEANGEAREDKIYRTGSNLPAKDHGNVRTIDAEALRDAVRKAEQPRHGH
jgi:hypothetical protein